MTVGEVPTVRASADELSVRLLDLNAKRVAEEAHAGLTRFQEERWSGAPTPERQASRHIHRDRTVRHALGSIVLDPRQAEARRGWSLASISLVCMLCSWYD